MALSFQSFLLYGVLVVLSCFPTNVWSFEKHPAIFIFGDSFFDAGSNNHLQTPFKYNIFPYGETFFKFATGRPSDGRIIPDFIARYLTLPFIPPYRYQSIAQSISCFFGMNFASSGSGALDETHKGQTISLKGQLVPFKEVIESLRQRFGDEETKAILLDAVYLFSIGTNDYGRLIIKSSNSTQLLVSIEEAQQYVNLVIGNIIDVIKEIYVQGGRKFGFENMGEIGCFPTLRRTNPTGECSEELSSVCRLHNQNFSDAMKTLQNQLHGFKYAIFDFYKALSERIDNPSKYGFKNSHAACCGSGAYRGLVTCGKQTGGKRDYELCDNPNEYLFFDTHFTENANKQFAQLMWNGNSDYISPYNLQQLFQA